MVELLHRILTSVHQALQIILRLDRRSGAGHASSPCYFFSGMYRSVIVPSDASAAMPIVSDNVGCGWIVRPMSAASAPISIASAASAAKSPADVPTMPHPMIGSCSSRPKDNDRPLAAQGNTPLPYLLALALMVRELLASVPGQRPVKFAGQSLRLLDQ